MPLGAHLPTSKGLEAALRQAQELGCDCLQIFSKSPRQWHAPALDPSKVAAFRAAWREAKLAPLVAHDSYLINLAAPDDTIRERSIRAMIDEVERAEMLGCDFLVTHCGAHLQKDCGPDLFSDFSGGSSVALAAGVETGLRRLAQSLRVVLEETPAARVRVALENTAGQGTCLGGPFEHLARVLDDLQSDRLHICFDTCHAFAAGHDISTAAGLSSTVDNLKRSVGLDRLALIHLNDSKGALGSHLDRHEHIGQGHIGPEAVQRIVTHQSLRELPFILETPEVETMIAANLETVRQLRDTGDGGMRHAVQQNVASQNVAPQNVRQRRSKTRCGSS